MTTLPDRLLTNKEAADYLNVSKSTFHKILNAGYIKRTYLLPPDKLPRIHPDELRRYDSTSRP